VPRQELPRIQSGVYVGTDLPVVDIYLPTSSIGPPRPPTSQPPFRQENRHVLQSQRTKPQLNKLMFQPPYRADQVGTFLRPKELLEARKKHQSGELSTQSLKELEDRLIIDLVAKEKKNGYRSITDGDFRRGHWFLDFLLNLDGVSVRQEITADGIETQIFQVKG